VKNDATCGSSSTRGWCPFSVARSAASNENGRVPEVAPGKPGDFQARALRQQRGLLLAGAALIAPYYLAFFAVGVYPLAAMLVGLLIPALLALAGWRLPLARPAEGRGWQLAVTAGMSTLAVLTAALADGTACVGFHVIWALPLLYTILVPSSLPACLAGAAIAGAGGVLLMVRDGHPATQVVQWAVLVGGASLFAANRVQLNRRERAAFLDQERHAATRLATSEERYRLLAENIQDVIWTLDLATGRFSYVSPSILQQRGFTVEEAMRQTLAEALTPESLERAALVMATMGTPEEENPHSGVYDQPCRDGSVRHMEISATLVRDAQGRPLEVIGVSRDVTARVEAERELRHSEERFRALIERSTDLILVFDRDKRIQFWSAGATEALGWLAEEVLGKRLFDLEIIHPDDVPAVAEATRRLAGGRGPTTVRIRARHRHKDGSWRLLEGLGRNLLDDPAVQGVVVNARDVTEQQRLEAQIQQSQKLESIGRLAGGVAHDFNNVLTVMMSCGEAIRRDVAAGDAVDPEDLLELRSAGDRARDLTRQLLAFARRQPVAPVPLDLNTVVRASEKLLRRVLGEDLQLVVDLEPDLGTVLCDAGQLDQVIINLAVNARDAMPEGGTLTIETHNVSVSAEDVVRHPDWREGDWVRLTVRDTGVGMTSEVKAHLFEPFFTTKAQGEGTGLGLATVYGIISQSGGHIHVSSDPGQGASLTICLPRQAAAAAQVVPAGGAAQVARGTEQVLVVEDDPLVRGVTVRTLRRAGYRVVIAATGEEALQAVEREPGTPALVVTDVVMPGMNGRQVAEALRRRDPRLRVLYVSGYARGTIGPPELAVPGTAFLPKPFSADALLAQVRSLLDAR
jgi:PAS domain S-box-containing protein